MRQPSLERDLIGRMQAGDTSAVAELASTYGPRIQQLAFRYVKNWEDAEEVDPGRPAEGLPEDRRVPRRRGAVVVDLPDHVQHGDVAAADGRVCSRQVEVQTGRTSANARTSSGRCRSRRTGRRWPTIRCCAAQMRTQLDRGADAPAGGVSGAGDSARHPGAVDGRSERGPAGEAADAEVAAAPRPSDSARAPGDFAGGVMLHVRESIN